MRELNHQSQNKGRIHMVPIQTELCQELPPVYGNREYRELKTLLDRMDEIILQSNLENVFIESFPTEASNTPKKRQRLLEALRCTLLRQMFRLSYGRLACELACNHLYQKFCGLFRIDKIEVPSAKTLERYEKMASSEMLQQLVAHLNSVAATGTADCEQQTLALETPVTLGVEYVDATAVKARVHYPVDWLLLRDMVRTLTLAIAQARKYGVCSRLPKEPQAYRTAMNKLCIEMTHARRTKDAVQKRKAIFRRMKKLVRVVEKLSQGHLAKLRRQGAASMLSVAQQLMLEHKFTVILDQLDAVIHQAHERIIGGRPVASADKILSLYEPDMHVIVRGKTNAEVEFGNTLFLAEQADGLIVDWHLYQEQAPADSRMIPEHLRRMENDHEIALRAIVGDRGFDSAKNSRLLGDTIANHLCPRNVEHFKQQLQDKTFCRHQRRRAQTEARIAIVMHGFLGNPMRKWGYKNKARLCGWGILAHNLWVLARLPQQAAQAKAA
jgi:hypothetical protein